MKTLNIDTLKVEGKEDAPNQLVLTSGADNQPIGAISDYSYTYHNLKILHDALMGPRLKLTSELKRIIMVLHLDNGPSIRTDDIMFYRDFSKNSYVKFYNTQFSCTMLLGVKNDRIALRNITLTGVNIQDYAVDEYFRAKMEQVQETRALINKVNQCIDDVFKQY